MSTADAAPKCAYCGMLPHQGVCPTVKAFEYHPDGTVKRVEFKTPADYAIPMYPMPSLPGSHNPNPVPWPITWGQPNWNDPKLTGAAVIDHTDVRTYTTGGRQ